MSLKNAVSLSNVYVHANATVNICFPYSRVYMKLQEFNEHSPINNTIYHVQFVTMMHIYWYMHAKMLFVYNLFVLMSRSVKVYISG